ncbi:MAG TPA: cytochrome P450 [Thermoanaerobaculia bacterium]|nr:cytochrome P450 [Thermoanaerobaculia bacterium]
MTELFRRAFRKAARITRRVFGDAIPLSAATIDFDAAAIATDPFSAYDLLRASGPVHFLARHSAWIIVGHEELRAAFAMPQLLSNQPYEDVDAVLLAADPPEHTAIRRITSRYFSREVIEAIARSTAEAAPRLLEKRRLDAVRDYAEPLSELAAAQLIGLDDDALQRVRAAGAHFTDFTRFVGDLRALADRSAMYERLRGDGLNEAQARSLVALFWVASTKTTERTIAAAMFRLVTHDDVRRELQRDKAAIGRFLDEVLRLHQPEPMLRRLAKAPVELGGTTIPAGSVVYLCLAGANRDPVRYERPHELLLDRGGSGHLSFGHGIHYCIGAALAKTVVDAAVRELLADGREVQLAQPAESIRWQASMMVRFIDSLDVSIARDEIPPLDSSEAHASVMQLALGHVASRAVYTFVRFRIADHLASGLRTPAELAHVTHTNEPALLRLLRAASALRLVSEDASLGFALTPLGDALRSDAPRHAASAVLAMGGQSMWDAFGELSQSIETGDPVLARVGGPRPFSDATAASAERTAQTQMAFYGDEPTAIAAAYDFSTVRVLADIGGSSGNLITTILSGQAAMRGILFDLPPVADAARAMLARRGVADRCKVVSGSFFDSVPAGADLYVLSHVLHDWPETQVETILGNVRRAIPADGRLLVIEPLLTPGSDSDVAKFLDVIALAITGGRHRTLDEHRELLARCGFRMTRVIACTGVSILESEPA